MRSTSQLEWYLLTPCSTVISKSVKTMLAGVTNVDDGWLLEGDKIHADALMSFG